MNWGDSYCCVTFDANVFLVSETWLILCDNSLDFKSTHGDVWWHVGAVVNSVTSHAQQEGCGFESGDHTSLCVLIVFLPHPTCRLTENSKLPIGVYKSVWIVVCYACWPCDGLVTYPGCTPPSPQSHLGLVLSPGNPQTLSGFDPIICFSW